MLGYSENRVLKKSIADENAMILRFNVTSSTRDVTIFNNYTSASPIPAFDYTIDWGDSSNNQVYSEASSTGVTHHYSSDGVFDVKITGTMTNINTYSDGIIQLVEIVQWGNVGLTNPYRLFYNCYNLSILPENMCLPTFVGNDLIQDYAYSYYYTNIITAVIPDGYTYVPYGLFSNATALTSVSLPNSIVLLSEQCLRETAISTITIPVNVVEIGSYAIYKCLQLTEIICLSITPPQIGTKPFHKSPFSIPTDIVIKVPAGSVSAYKNAWSIYAGIIEAI